MKKKLLILLATSLLALPVFALTDLRSADADRESDSVKSEKPFVKSYERIELQVKEARYGFKGVSDAQLELKKNDKLILSFYNGSTDGQQKIELPIESKTVDKDGTIRYHAYQSTPMETTGSASERSPRNVGARTSVTVVDYSKSNSNLEELRANLIEVSVRRGFGWCGTMDSTMKLVGKPFISQPIELAMEVIRSGYRFSPEGENKNLVSNPLIVIAGNKVTLTYKSKKESPECDVDGRDCNAENADEDNKVELSLNSVTTDKDGVVTYSANFNTYNDASDGSESVDIRSHIGARNHLVITDYRNAKIAAPEKHLVTATYNRGYGWCGTMDYVLELGAF